MVTDETLSTFDDGRIEVALTALDADFANFAGGNTVFDQVEFENPQSLLDLFGGQGTQDFF